MRLFLIFGAGTLYKSDFNLYLKKCSLCFKMCVCMSLSRSLYVCVCVCVSVYVGICVYVLRFFLIIIIMASCTIADFLL